MGRAADMEIVEELSRVALAMPSPIRSQAARRRRDPKIARRARGAKERGAVVVRHWSSLHEERHRADGGARYSRARRLTSARDTRRIPKVAKPWREAGEEAARGSWGRGLNLSATDKDLI